ncbi:hypothetical protein BB561_001766 [Smittium simulii]|uniref:Uncharacterized protein n=1 Tax=Smittium simulii TaxID=133385 RepID=A0A2T9YT64_9FUNG|nr:hypothetical protein BB561_001766 [Smittium simulii]
MTLTVHDSDALLLWCAAQGIPCTTTTEPDLELTVAELLLLKTTVTLLSSPSVASNDSLKFHFCTLLRSLLLLPSTSTHTNDTKTASLRLYRLTKLLQLEILSHLQFCLDASGDHVLFGLSVFAILLESLRNSLSSNELALFSTICLKLNSHTVKTFSLVNHTNVFVRLATLSLITNNFSQDWFCLELLGSLNVSEYLVQREATKLFGEVLNFPNKNGCDLSFNCNDSTREQINGIVLDVTKFIHSSVNTPDCIVGLQVCVELLNNPVTCSFASHLVVNNIETFVKLSWPKPASFTNEIDIDIENLATESLVLLLDNIQHTFTTASLSQTQKIITEIFTCSNTTDLDAHKKSGLPMLVSKLVAYIDISIIINSNLDSLIFDKFSEFIDDAKNTSLKPATTNTEFALVLDGTIILARKYSLLSASCCNSFDKYKPKIDRIVESILNLACNRKLLQRLGILRLYTQLASFLLEFQTVFVKSATIDSINAMIKDIGNYELGSLAVEKLCNLLLKVKCQERFMSSSKLGTKIEQALESRLSVDLDESVRVSIILQCGLQYSELYKIKARAVSKLGIDKTHFKASELDVQYDNTLETDKEDGLFATSETFSKEFVDIIVAFLDDSSSQVRTETVRFIQGMVQNGILLKHTPDSQVAVSVLDEKLVKKLKEIGKIDQTTVRIQVAKFAAMVIKHTERDLEMRVAGLELIQAIVYKDTSAQSSNKENKTLDGEINVQQSNSNDETSVQQSNSNDETSVQQSNSNDETSSKSDSHKESPKQKATLSWKNLAIGAFIQTAEVTTLGQPFEVVKTHMAANRQDGVRAAIKKTYARGGLRGFYQGLIPWAWIEASTKGAVLLYTSSEVEHIAAGYGASRVTSGLLGGMLGGLAQAYTTMGFCTFMKTVEVTRQKQAGVALSTYQVAYDVFKREGIRGLNRGVSAVALRQMTNWGSRFGIARVTEAVMKGKDKTRKLSNSERVIASVVGGTLSCWNQPLEVIRVEMQSQLKSKDRPTKMNIVSCAKYIYAQSGFRGFYRGVLPRIGLSVYLTTCMVFGGDTLKAYFANK